MPFFLHLGFENKAAVVEINWRGKENKSDVYHDVLLNVLTKGFEVNLPCEAIWKSEAWNTRTKNSSRDKSLFWQVTNERELSYNLTGVL